MVARHILARIAAPALLAVGTLGAALADDRLDRVQQQLSASRDLDVAAIVERLPALARSVDEYLRAYRPRFDPGGDFYLWYGNEEVREAFQRRLVKDLRAWHPVAELLFLEMIVSCGPNGVYARMLDLGGPDARTAIREHVAEIVRQIEEFQPTIRDPPALADAMVRRQVEDLWEMMSAILQDHAVRILRENLQLEPQDTSLDTIWRAEGWLAQVFEHPDCRRLSERIREDKESTALAQAVYGTATRVLSHAALPGPRRKGDFEHLLRILVLLQTWPAEQYLVLLFDLFDDYRKFPAVGEQKLEEELVKAVVDFISASVAQDPKKVLALELMDHLSRMILTHLELRFPELLPARLIVTLDMIRTLHPGLNVEMIEHFHLKFHALDPAGYEALIFQLTDILVEYAEHGLFLADDPRSGPVADDGGQQQQVMDVLRWYNQGLAEVAAVLPEIDIAFMDRKQRDVLDRIYGYFELKSGGSWGLERDDPRWIETLLLLLTRIAHAARPGDLVTHVLLPLTRVECESSLWSAPYLTGPMRASMDFLWALVGEEQRSKLERQMVSCR